MKTVRMQTFAEVEHVLEPYRAIVQEITGKDITLKRMAPLMKALGNPQENLRVIHIAGTSGKTSTAYYIAALLHSTGKTVGLTVSPHISVLSERVQVNGVPLSESEFARQLSDFLTSIKDVTPMPSYFELLMAFAYWYFAKIKVDYMVVETGLGGLFDASNICQNNDKVCVLTDIGYDHMHILGSALPEIARQKAGIMYQGNMTLCFNQEEPIINTFEQYAHAVGAKLTVLDERTERANLPAIQQLEQLPRYQQRNWLLAHAVYQSVARRDQLPELDAPQQITTMQTYIPGRMEIMTINGKTIILDGAHNPQKMRAFVSSFELKYPRQRVPVLLGLKKNKDNEVVEAILKPIASQIIKSDIQNEQFIETAFRTLLDETDVIAVVTGSFYLIAAVRKLMLEA